ncbi:mersacidin family lantibiotic [Bacillus cereus]|uniref:mersacidin family lantibiotic n=1 Tax=Bacillus cereus TaxID=1396 RepID=UPI0018793FAC|nr:mersacidin family lantibiotic [Bacillus cereus]MBE7099296.1 hypothetical protein [Bacillus cereus]
MFNKQNDINSESHPCGKSMRELSRNEIQQLYGGTDNGLGVEARSSFVCSALWSFVGSYITSATLECKGRK